LVDSPVTGGYVCSIGPELPSIKQATDCLVSRTEERHMASMRRGLAFLFLMAGVAASASEPQPIQRESRARRPPPSAAAIHRAFRSRADELRVRLLKQFQDSGREGDRPEQVSALTEGLQQRLSRAAANIVDLKLLWQLSRFPSDEAARALEAFLGNADLRVTLTALQGLLTSQRPPAWDRVQPLTQRPDYDEVYALRRAVVDAAQRSGTRDALDLLVATVADSDGQLKYEAARALTLLTGQTFGGHGEEWSAWWNTARDEFQPKAARPDSRPPISLVDKIAWDGPVPEFFDVPIYARRVLFILDRSNSMASSVDGETRIDRARQELEQALLKLPEDSEFNLLVYHDLVEAFSPRLAPATADRKREAIVFAERVIPERKTACYDALALGLEDHPNLEAIYFLSDGEPTAGAIIDMNAIVEAITEQNRLKLVSIYTLGIDARGAHEQFLRDLAARDYGEFFLIR
jgi:hypothetical protein